MRLYGWLILSLILDPLISSNITFGATITSTSASNDNLFVQWSTSDPEQIDIIKWNPTGLTGNEPNLTNAGTNPFVPGDCNGSVVEYFGNSYAPPDPQDGGRVLVGAGTTGTRVAGPDHRVNINSSSTDCVPISAEVPVKTTYKFWQAGASINRIKVDRVFTFTTPFSNDFRPYIPRLFPYSDFSQVLHPNVSGTNLVTESVFDCPFGCIVTDWDGNNAAISWFTIHNPSSGQGLIVRRTPSTFPIALWIDNDDASSTNASSVLALQPSGHFTGRAEEEEFLCFYDSTTWTPSLRLPPGCLPPKNADDLVTFVPLASTYRTSSAPADCPSGFVGQFSFEARLTVKNSSPPISDLAVQVKNLTNGNLLHNADGGDGGVGSTLAVFEKNGYSDGILSRGEFVDVNFSICLKDNKPFTFFVDVLGMP